MFISDETRQCVRLLKEGKPEQAEELVAGALAALDARQRAVELERALLQEILNIIRERPEGPSPDVVIVQHISTAERHLAIVQVATEIASHHPMRYASTDAVFAAMQARGEVVPSKTAIGNVLRWADGWTRIGQGLYQLEEQAEVGNAAAVAQNGASPKAVRVEEVIEVA